MVMLRDGWKVSRKAGSDHQNGHNGALVLPTRAVSQCPETRLLVQEQVLPESCGWRAGPLPAILLCTGSLSRVPSPSVPGAGPTALEGGPCLTCRRAVLGRFWGSQATSTLHAVELCLYVCLYLTLPHLTRDMWKNTAALAMPGGSAS